MDMGAGDGEHDLLHMSEVSLRQVLHYVHARLSYQFDLFADRAYYLELTDVAKAAPSTSYPRELFATARSPTNSPPKLRRRTSRFSTR